MQHKHNNFIQYSGTIGFAGSRHGTVPQAGKLVSAFARQDVSFLVGCAPGVDRCFRNALAASPAAIVSTVHCAFPSLLQAVSQEGLREVCLVAGASSVVATLHRRTAAHSGVCSHRHSTLRFERIRRGKGLSFRHRFRLPGRCVCRTILHFGMFSQR